jgi:hypothetical protein
MGILSCLEGLSCSRSPAVSRTARKLCNDFQIVATRYVRGNDHLPFCMARSAIALLAHRQHRDEFDHPIEEAIEQFSRFRLQLDKDPSAIVRIASQIDQPALSQAMDNPLRVPFRRTRCCRQRGL